MPQKYLEKYTYDSALIVQQCFHWEQETVSSQ